MAPLHKASKLTDVLWTRQVSVKDSGSVFVAHCTTSFLTDYFLVHRDNCRAVRSQNEDGVDSASDQSAEEDRLLSVQLASRQVEANSAVE